MALYYLPSLIRSDRYFINRLESGKERQPDFNFVIPAENRVLTPLFSFEDISRITLNQMAPSESQDIPLNECAVSLNRNADGFELLIRKTGTFAVEKFHDEETGMMLEYFSHTRRLSVAIYQYRVKAATIPLTITLCTGEGQLYSTLLLFSIVHPEESHKIVIDFGSEASQVGFRNGGPQSSIVPYDIMENLVSRLNLGSYGAVFNRADFLNHEPGQPLLYRSFYAVRKQISGEARKEFPFNFTDDMMEDEIRLFITRKEVAATEHRFRDQYSIVPNLKLGIEKSLQLNTGAGTEDYSIRSNKQELISAILLRLLRLMIASKPGFRKGGLIVTLLVPNIYTQHEVFSLLSLLRRYTGRMLATLSVPEGQLNIEFETISESDAAFMGYQQTHPEEVNLSNGEMALVIDSGKGTTDISVLLADDNQNYSSFFRTGFAGAGNVLQYGFIEDFLTLVLRAIPGHNDIRISEFISRHIQDQHMTADVLNFLELMEDQKRQYRERQALDLPAFSGLSEKSSSTDRTVGNLHKDLSTLLAYSADILSGRNNRWDGEITGLIQKAVDCIVHSITAGIREVMTKDIRRRIKLVMLSGRAFYFGLLREKLESALREILHEQISIRSLPSGRTLNNKNVSLYGAFSGAYKITDFTGMPIDRKEGLSGNNDVLNNNLFLYRGLKIEPCNDILYNSSMVRRNNQDLIAFKNKTIDVCFTRDNIYLRLMENQRVKDVKSLFSVLAPVPENYAMAEDLRAISMFPNYSGTIASLAALHSDIVSDASRGAAAPKKRIQRKIPFLPF